MHVQNYLPLHTAMRLNCATPQQARISFILKDSLYEQHSIRSVEIHGPES